MTILNFVLGSLIIITGMIALASAYNAYKRNQSLAMGMLHNVMTAELREVFKTLSRGNNVHAPMKHLCQNMCYYMALFNNNDEAIRRMNDRFTSVREGLLGSTKNEELPEISVEMHPRLSNTLLINVTGVGSWTQDLHNFTNFENVRGPRV